MKIFQQDNVVSDGVAFNTIWQGGKGFIFAKGTWGGATVALQVGDGHGNYNNAGTSTTLTADGQGGFEWAAGLPVQVLVSSASGTTTIDIEVATAF